MRRTLLTLLRWRCRRSVVGAQRDGPALRRAQQRCRATFGAKSSIGGTEPNALRSSERLEIDAGREVRGDVTVRSGPLIIAGHVTGNVLAINSDVAAAPDGAHRRRSARRRRRGRRTQHRAHRRQRCASIASRCSTAKRATASSRRTRRRATIESAGGGASSGVTRATGATRCASCRPARTIASKDCRSSSDRRSTDARRGEASPQRGRRRAHGEQLQLRTQRHRPQSARRGARRARPRHRHRRQAFNIVDPVETLAADRSRDRARVVRHAPRLPRLLPAPRRQRLRHAVRRARPQSDRLVRRGAMVVARRCAIPSRCSTATSVARRIRIVDEGLFHLANADAQVRHAHRSRRSVVGMVSERRPRVRSRHDHVGRADVRTPRIVAARDRSRLHARLLRLPPIQSTRTGRAAEHARGARRLDRRRSAAARATTLGRRTGRASRLRFSERARRTRRRHVQRRARRRRAARRSAIASRSRRSSIAAICVSTSRATGKIGRATITARTATSRGWCSPTRVAGGDVGTPDGTLDRTAAERCPPLSTFRSDVGLGLDFGGIGIYAAKAMSTPTEPMNFFVRLRHRF